MPTPILIIVYIFLAVLFVVGLANAVVPRWVWKTFESWKAVSEPSKAYFITQRIIGIVQMLVVVLMIAIPTIIYLLH